MKSLFQAHYLIVFSIIVAPIAEPVIASNAGVPDEKAPERNLDDAFNEALYLYASLRVDEAFGVMDLALRTMEPTENWESHLRLYRMSFNDSHGNFWAFHKHSDKAQYFIEQLKSKPDATDRDLVRLTMILPLGGNDVYDIATARELHIRYPDSPWAPGARWMIIENAFGHANEIFVPASSELPIRRRGLSVQLDDLIRQELRSIVDASKPSIMQKHLSWRLNRIARAQLYRVQRSLDTLRSSGGRASIKDEFEAHLQAMIGLLSEIEAHHFTPEERFRRRFMSAEKEDLWDYFHGLRQSGVNLPNIIPADKEAFLDSTLVKPSEVQFLLHQYRVHVKLEAFPFHLNPDWFEDFRPTKPLPKVLLEAAERKPAALPPDWLEEKAAAVWRSLFEFIDPKSKDGWLLIHDKLNENSVAFAFYRYFENRLYEQIEAYYGCECGGCPELVSDSQLLKNIGLIGARSPDKGDILVILLREMYQLSQPWDPLVPAIEAIGTILLAAAEEKEWCNICEKTVAILSVITEAENVVEPPAADASNTAKAVLKQLKAIREQ